VLPGAQVGEAELEEIVKIGQAGENTKALVNGGSDASGRLLSDYDGLEGAKMARTPRTAPQGLSVPNFLCVSIAYFTFGHMQRITL
jgi:pre-mRNA-splicing factor CDC5/CEF1